MTSENEEPFDPFNAPYRPIKFDGPVDGLSNPIGLVEVRARTTIIGVGTIAFGGGLGWALVFHPGYIGAFSRIAFFGLAVVMVVCGLVCIRNAWKDVWSSLVAARKRRRADKSREA